MVNVQMSSLSAFEHNLLIIVDGGIDGHGYVGHMGCQPLGVSLILIDDLPWIQCFG